MKFRILGSLAIIVILIILAMLGVANNNSTSNGYESDVQYEEYQQ